MRLYVIKIRDILTDDTPEMAFTQNEGDAKENDGQIDMG